MAWPLACVAWGGGGQALQSLAHRASKRPVISRLVTGAALLPSPYRYQNDFCSCNTAIFRYSFELCSAQQLSMWNSRGCQFINPLPGRTTSWFQQTLGNSCSYQFAPYLHRLRYVASRPWCYLVYLCISSTPTTPRHLSNSLLLISTSEICATS